MECSVVFQKPLARSIKFPGATWKYTELLDNGGRVFY